MDDKKLKKITKKELLEILLSQAKRIEELEQELETTKKELQSKKIIIEESGSIAEASLRLNKIFEIAQETADQYIMNIKEKCKQQEKEAKLKVKELSEKKEKKSLKNKKKRSS